MIAKIAYLTTPAPGRYVLRFQPEGEEGCRELEISRAHLANIIIDGTTLALRDIDQRIHRVPETKPESADGRSEHRT